MIPKVLICLLIGLFFFSCKKESKEFTTVEWVVINPVTNNPYVNMLVRLYEAKATNDGIEYKLIYEGKTNHQGRAQYSFKAALSGKYWYKPEINEGSLGVGGIDYKVIKQPSPSVENVKKDEENEVRYEIVPYAKFYRYVKNVNCQGTDDKMRYRSKSIYTSSSGEFTSWSPNSDLNSGYFEGCYEYISPLRTNPSDSVIYEVEVTRNGITEVMIQKFYRNPNSVDTLKIFY